MEIYIYYYYYYYYYIFHFSEFIFYFAVCRCLFISYFILQFFVCEYFLLISIDVPSFKLIGGQMTKKARAGRLIKQVYYFGLLGSLVLNGILTERLLPELFKGRKLLGQSSLQAFSSFMCTLRWPGLFIWREIISCLFGGKSYHVYLAANHIIFIWRQIMSCLFGGKSYHVLRIKLHVSKRRFMSWRK